MTRAGGGVIGPLVGRLGGAVERAGEGEACCRGLDGDGEGEDGTKVDPVAEGVGFDAVGDGVIGESTPVCVQATNVVAAMANVAMSTRTLGASRGLGEVRA